MKREMTATVYIVEKGKVLLIHHRKLDKWLPPGGHLENGEIPPEGAKREALEETGLAIELIQQENVWINRPNASSFERPYLCLLEEIPAFGNEPAHQHVDFIYLAKPSGGKAAHNEKEVQDMRWFTIDEIESLKSEVEIFLETKETIRTFLGENCVT